MPDCNETSGAADEEGLSRQQLQSLEMISAAAGTLSVLGSLFIIVTFHIIYGVGRSGRRSGAVPVSTRIVYWISISDIVVSLCYIMPAGEMALADRTNCGDFRCLLLAAMSQFFTLVRLVPASTFGSHCPLFPP